MLNASNPQKGINEVFSMVIEKLASNGIAITPLVRLWTYSSICQFVTTYNFMTPNNNYIIQSYPKVDSIFYDITTGSEMLKVIHRTIMDSLNQPYTQSFSY